MHNCTYTHTAHRLSHLHYCCISGSIFRLSLSLNIILYRKHLNQQFLSGYLFSINAIKFSLLCLLLFFPIPPFTMIVCSSLMVYRTPINLIECSLTSEFYLQLWLNEKSILKYQLCTRIYSVLA